MRSVAACWRRKRATGTGSSRKIRRRGVEVRGATLECLSSTINHVGAWCMIAQSG
jgi:hypothetical protein